MANYLDKLAQIESSNKVYSLNPATNASGLFQITPQTKINLEKAYPELKDFDPFDVNDAYKAAEILTEENVKALKNSGMSVTDGNKYVLHFMGSGKGRELIKLSNDKNFANKLASDVFPKEASKNKAIFKGKTVAEVYKTITNKMKNVKITPRYFGEKVEMVSPTPRGVTIRKDLPTEVIEQQKDDFTPMDTRPDSDVVPPFKPEPKPEPKVEPDSLEMIDVPMTSKQRKELADRYREKLGIPTKKGLFGLGYTIPGTRIGFNKGGVSGFMTQEPSGTVEEPTRKKLKDVLEKLDESKGDIAKGAAELFIPGVGEAMAVKRVSDAMDEKDYVGAGIETAAGLAGVFPVLGDAAGKGLRKVFSRKEIEDASPSWFKETEVSKDIKPEDAQKTQITTTTSTYKKAKEILPEGKTLDFGAGKGVGAKEVGSDTYEPFPDKSFSPTYTDSKSIPSNSYDNITSLNVLNVVKPDVRSDIVQDIGRILKPNGTAIITTRGMDIFGNAKNPVKGILADEPRAVITSTGTYQKGFTPKELKEYIESELGENFEVTNVRDLGKAGVKVKKNLKMAEGGAVPMEKQMSMFEDGGLMDEGGTIDPISGNDVPPGSTQEEVRDDIPAQLSEGEFVFPADVVRYIGLEKLMQMRQEAKRGLEMMDKMGQMGNSEEAVIPDDIPFELSDLDMEDEPVEMQQGGLTGPATGIAGFVPSQVPATSFVQQPQTPVTSTVEQPTQASVPIAPTYTPVTQQEVPTFAPEDMQDVSYPGVVQTPESAPQTVEIVNPTTGERRTITYIPGVTQLPEGFVLASEYDGSAQATSVTPTVGQAQVRKDTTSERRKEKAAREKMDLDNARLKMTQELFPFTKPADPFSVSTALGKLEPGTRTATGYIIGDNGEYLDPLTGEQAFFGFESAKYALSPEDKPELKIKPGGINEKFVQKMIEQERAGRDRLDKAMIDRQIARQTSLAGQKKAAKKTFDAQRSAKTVQEVKKELEREEPREKKDRDKRIKELEKETKQMTAYEGGIKKGGLLTKTKPKPKKMRSGGLASKK